MSEQQHSENKTIKMLFCGRLAEEEILQYYQNFNKYLQQRFIQHHQLAGSRNMLITKLPSVSQHYNHAYQQNQMHMQQPSQTQKPQPLISDNMPKKSMFVFAVKEVEHSASELPKSFAPPKTPQNFVPPSRAVSERGLKRKQPKDPNAPKRYRSAYNFYMQDVYKKARALHPEYLPTEIVRMIGQEWMKMDAEAKEKYKQQAEKDMQRYHTQMYQYLVKKSTKRRDELSPIQLQQLLQTNQHLQDGQATTESHGQIIEVQQNLGEL